MKKIILFLASLMLFTACGAGVPDISDQLADIPTEDEILAQVNKNLTDAGLEAFDLDEYESSQPVKDEAGPDIKISKEKKEIGVTFDTVAVVWPEVKAFVQSEYPGAVLIGYNNNSVSDRNTYLYKLSPVLDGKSKQWYYFFVKDQGALADGFVDNKSELFVAVFDEGKLSFDNGDLFSEEFGENQLVGEGLFANDSSAIFEAAQAALVAEFGTLSTIKDIDIDCEPVWPIDFADGKGRCDLTFYRSKNVGYNVDISITDLSISTVEEITFTSI